MMPRRGQRTRFFVLVWLLLHFHLPYSIKRRFYRVQLLCIIIDEGEKKKKEKNSNNRPTFSAEPRRSFTHITRRASLSHASRSFRCVACTLQPSSFTHSLISSCHFHLFLFLFISFLFFLLFFESGPPLEDCALPCITCAHCFPCF